MTPPEASLLLTTLGVIALAVAGLGVPTGRAHFGWLGLAVLAAGVLLVPAWQAAT